jgi:hypothetical protein
MQEENRYRRESTVDSMQMLEAERRVEMQTLGGTAASAVATSFSVFYVIASLALILSRQVCLLSEVKVAWVLIFSKSSLTAP